MKLIFTTILCFLTFQSSTSINLILVGPVKFFVNNSDTTSVSKLPPILEYFLQRVQAANSNYVHEDLSRPQTWEKPVYTLSPAEEEMFYGPASTKPLVEEAVVVEDEVTTTTSKYDNFEYVDEDNSTELLFEKITEAPPPFSINNNQYVIYKIETSKSQEEDKE
ncbi:uncharacterized protein LOC123310703 isoform X1 [Coccinella septempunctata]|uniref:uncharacterized protein LOC123310703 isoform X1 n=1 Tax=Coccinella septempunctata TaxID=41139 RepID=UPI001D0823E6|nr:uncharacterized protein LOC123310703 isoform X1 [Coccinella septempunctata]